MKLRVSRALLDTRTKTLKKILTKFGRNFPKYWFWSKSLIMQISILWVNWATFSHVSNRFHSYCWNVITRLLVWKHAHKNRKVHWTCLIYIYPLIFLRHVKHATVWYRPDSGLITKCLPGHSAVSVIFSCCLNFGVDSTQLSFWSLSLHWQKTRDFFEIVGTSPKKTLITTD